jgi:hypothetical protein
LASCRPAERSEVVALVTVLEVVAAEEVDVVGPERGEPDDVIVGEVRFVELGECSVEVAGVPQDNGVEDEPERAKLVFLAGAVGLAELAALAVEHASGEGVAGFLDREAPMDLAAVGVVVVDEREDVEGLGDAAVFGPSLRLAL